MSTTAWLAFNVLVVFLLCIDLFVVNRKARIISFKEAAISSSVWIALALLFNLLIYYRLGKEPAINFLTGYLIEKTLSVDNLFVFLLIFKYFDTPKTSWHKVLFWGVLGAIIIRGICIFLGVALVVKFHVIIYVFGSFLVFSGIKLIIQKDKQVQPERNPVVRLFRVFFPVTNEFENDKFFVKKGARLMATPLCLVLLTVETADIIFAIDSIPAILAITYNPFIIYSSNVFAILGLRALFFLLHSLIQYFKYIHYGISAILVFVGFKMILSDLIPVPPLIALGVIATILTVSIILSLVKRKRDQL